MDVKEAGQFPVKKEQFLDDREWAGVGGCCHSYDTSE